MHTGRCWRWRKRGNIFIFIFIVHAVCPSEPVALTFVLSVRLQLSPSPSQHAAVPRTHEHGSRKLRGKKRKHDGASGSSPAYKVSSRVTEHGPVSVEEVDVDGKYVRLKNMSERVRT